MNSFPECETSLRQCVGDVQCGRLAASGLFVSEHRRRARAGAQRTQAAEADARSDCAVASTVALVASDTPAARAAISTQRGSARTSRLE